VDTHIPPEVLRVRADGVMLLGGPVGGADNARSIVTSQVDKISAICSQLEALQDSQIALTLLRSCAGFPKLAFALRTTVPEVAVDQYRRFDSVMHSTLSVIAGCDLSSSATAQANLPPSLGGLGVPSAVVLGPAAFVASALQSLELQTGILGPTHAALVPRSCVPPILASLNSSLLPPASPLTVDDIQKVKHPQEYIT
jgi:hypothetical protein